MPVTSTNSSVKHWPSADTVLNAPRTQGFRLQAGGGRFARTLNSEARWLWNEMSEPGGST